MPKRGISTPLFNLTTGTPAVTVFSCASSAHTPPHTTKADSKSFFNDFLFSVSISFILNGYCFDTKVGHVCPNRLTENSEQYVTFTVNENDTLGYSPFSSVYPPKDGRRTPDCFRPQLIPNAYSLSIPSVFTESTSLSWRKPPRRRGRGDGGSSRNRNGPPRSVIGGWATRP